MRNSFTDENVASFCPKEVEKSKKLVRVCDFEKLYCALCAILFALDEQELSQIAELPYEYAARMKKAARSCESYSQFFDALRAKHITDAKLRRMIIYTLAGVKKEILSDLPKAAFLLSHSGEGAKILRRIKKENTDFTVLSKVSDIKKLSEKDAEIFNKQLDVERLFERMI